MNCKKGDFAVIVNTKYSTKLANGTYGVIDELDSDYLGRYAFRYRIRVISATGNEGKFGELYWVHADDVISAEFYCSENADLAIRDALTNHYLEQLAKAKSKKKKAEIIAVLSEMHPQMECV